MRCPDCNKFVSFDQLDPEVNSIEVDEDGNVSGSVRIVNACGDCSNELTESNFDIEVDLTKQCEGHQGEGHELEIEEDGVERTERSGYFDKKTHQFVPKGGRYAKTFYGFHVDFTVKCSCGKLGEKGEGISGSAEDDCQASSMDELV